MSCKPTYKGVRYNSLEELYNANGVNTQQAQQLYSQYLDTNPIVERGSKQDIAGFKSWVENIQQFTGSIGNQNNTQYQLPQGREIEEFVASEKTIRDLAARMSDRIGIPVRFEFYRSRKYKGKIENNIAYVNLAYATLDTPIHEILGHPIIRAIKYSKNIGGTITLKGLDTSTKKQELSQLYQNLLKELEYGKGAEVLDRVKKNYVYKPYKTTNENFTTDEGINYYLETMYGANSKTFYYKEDNTTSEGYLKGKVEITQEEYKAAQQNAIGDEKYTLEEQQEEAIVELLGLMTAEKLDKVKDSKLISLLKRLLKEMKAFMIQLLGQREVEIDKLPDNMTLGDIADLLAYSNSKLILPGNEVVYTTPDNQKFPTYQEASNHISKLFSESKDVDLSGVKLNLKDFVGKANLYSKEGSKYFITIPQFKRDKKAWDNFADSNNKVSVNNTEVMFYENDIPIGNYNKLSEITDWDRLKNIHENTAKNNKYDLSYLKQEIDLNNYKFNSVSGSNTPDNIHGFIEKNKPYEQAKEIIEEWKKVNNIQYNPEEVYSRGQEFVSVVAAYSDFDVNLMMQNLLQHIENNQKAGGEFTISAFTKPVGKQIGHLEGGGGKIKFKIYPQSKDIKWAANTDVHSGSVWDASEKVSKDKKSELLGVSYTKYPSLQNVNSVQPNLAATIDNLAHHHNELGISLTGNNFRLEYDEDIPYSTKKLINSINSILEQKYGKLVKPVIKKQQNQIHGSNVGIQPTQTKENTTSIESVKSNYIKENSVNIGGTYSSTQYVKGEYTYIFVEDNNDYYKQKQGEGLIDITKEEFEANKPKGKEYTEQALINLKIAKLKEVVKKYPRSLIRSEVRRIGFIVDEMSFQKISKSPNELPQEKLNEQVNNITSKYENEIKKIYDKLEMYSSDEYIPAKKYIPAVHLIQQYNRDNNNSNYELAMKRYYNNTSKIVVQRKSLIESKENNLLTKDEGNIRMTINDLFKKVDKDVKHEMEIALKIRTIEIKKVSEVPNEYSIMKVADLHHKELTKQYGALEGTIKYFEEITALNKRFNIKEFLNKEELMPFEKKLDDYNANNPGNSHFYQKVNLPTNDKRDKYIFKINFTKVENIADQQNTIISNIEEDNSISLDNKQEEKTDEEIKQELLAKKDFEKKAENIKENIIQYGNVQGKEFSQQKIIFPEDINLTDTQKSMLMNFDAHFPNHSFLTLLEKMLFVEALGDGDIIMYCKI